MLKKKKKKSSTSDKDIAQIIYLDVYNYKYRNAICIILNKAFYLPFKRKQSLKMI